MISVIIPCYNSAGFLHRAVDSVIAQTYGDWELILVNNNSKDDTQTVIEKYVQQYPDKIIGVNELGPGSAAARNCGLALAKGEWLQFLDADDELKPNRFELLVNIDVVHEDDIITTAYNYIEDGVVKNANALHQDEDVWLRLINSQLGRTSAVLWKKQAVVAAGGWDNDKTSSQEYNLIFKMLKNGARLTSFADRTVNIHATANSISRSVDKTKRLKIVNNYIRLRENIRAYLKQIGELTKRRQEAIDSLIFDNTIQYFDLAPLKMFLKSIACKSIALKHRLKCYKAALSQLKS
ncbi:glycosyltransferase family 2 protein [Mucilaginibacter aquatilis]|uniref:Glycosyltransferase n=1 Tax=Mucilaginibacter aquatilis TaxID=1517760 RepID=A0A6I4IGW4_9SPHI|nr:glycosyltransferase family A protein [Mucilaginibacter aquatilis]MVN92786.1 glycosyltransferase [Mucilaginibacter aquatilis]